MDQITKYILEKENKLQEAGFEKYPKGWDQDSVKKFGRSLSKKMKGGVKSKGFFDKCVEKMKDKMENPEGFCASIKDEVYGSTYWRGKDKSPTEVSKDVKKHKNVKENKNLLEYDEVFYIEQCNKENERLEDKLLCLKKAYILCGANRVCQQRIDRFFDALTNNFEQSGEVQLKLEMCGMISKVFDGAEAEDVEEGESETKPQKKLNFKSENYPDMMGSGMSSRIPPADTEEVDAVDEDKEAEKLPWSNNK